MAVLINENTKILVQGITGNQGRFHTRSMLQAGSKVVAGVTPGKGGMEVEGVPVFDTVEEAVRETGANAAILFVPAPFAKDAAFENIEAHLNPVVIITEHVPVHDTLEILTLASAQGVMVIGPNCPGLISPSKCKMGIMPTHIFKEGNIGIVSRSGTLTYEIAFQITRSGLGQSTCIGMGGDPLVGLTYTDALMLFEGDEQTKAIVLIGEIGGGMEEEAASFIIKHIKKPVVAYIAGRTAPPEKKMGHAGAIVSGTSGSAQGKIKALREAGIPVVDLPSQIPEILKEFLREK
ncbi:MAG: succinate--CoA ligase subunit alpha [Coprothermobacterota bacterium]|nr:succinate--CoA ligase subunit alpha [Coprothermobacterota bacterium]